MHAQRLALYLAPRSLLYFRHVIGHMPADAVDIFVPDDLVRNGGDDCPAFRELADAGYRFLPVGQAGGSYGAVGVAGQQDLERCPALAALSARRILLLHASAFVFLPDDTPFTHVLCQYAKQIDLGKPPAARPGGGPVREIFPAGHIFPFEVDNSNKVKGYLAAGLGYAFLPRGIVKKELAEGTFAEVAPLDFARMQLLSYRVCRSDEEERYF